MTEYSDLKEKTISSVKWNAISQFTGQGIIILGSVILSRILNPSLFGLFAMISVLGNLINLVVGLGINHAIIQNRSLTRHDIASFFWLNILAGLFVSVLFFFLAPLVAAFYDQPDLLPVTRIFSVVFVVAAAAIVPTALLARELSFRKLAVSNIAALLLSYCGALLLGFYEFGVWALVFQYISFQAITFVLNAVFASWWPAFTFEKESFQKIRKFVSSLLPTQILDYFTSTLDLLLVGKFFGKNELGIYGRAQAIIMMPVNNLSILLSKSFFSIFSLLQDDASKLKSNYVGSAKLLMLTIAPLLFSIALVPEDFVLIVFGDQWLEMSPLLPVLCVAGVIGSLNALNDGLFTSQGRTDILLRVVLIEKIVLVAFIACGMFFGLMGVACGKLAAQVFSFILRVHKQRAIMDVSVIFWLRSLLKIILASAVMVLVIILVKPFFADLSLIFRFSITVGLAIMTFFTTLLVFREEMLYKLKDVLYGFRKKKA